MNDQMNNQTGADNVNDNNTDSNTPMDRNEMMAVRMEILMEEGKTLTEALTLAQTEFAPPPVTVQSRVAISNRMEWISSLQRIDELRRAIKIAFAKKAKSKDKPDTIAKYQKEIDAGRARFNKLMSQVNKATLPHMKALELGEDLSGVLQRYLEYKEKGLEDRVKVTTSGLSASSRKNLLGQALVSTPWEVRSELLELGDAYLKSYEGRATKGDQRIITLNRRMNFLADQEVIAENENEEDLENGPLMDTINKLPPSEDTTESETPQDDTDTSESTQIQESENTTETETPQDNTDNIEIPNSEITENEPESEDTKVVKTHQSVKDYNKKNKK